MSNSLGLTIAFIALVFTGCSSKDSSSDESARVGSTAQADTTGVDLVSASTCTSRSAHLFSCKVGPASLVGHNIVTAVPLRTVITSKKSGDCSTQYPLQVTLTADDGTATVLPYLSQANAFVRRADGQSMASISLTDSSPWTKSAAFASTCSVQLGVSFNEPDVDTVDQAQAILTKLQADLQSKTIIASNYQDLVLYQQAYQLLQVVAQNFHGQLTNDTMQELRSAFNDSSDALLQLITSCDAGLTQDDKMNLARLYGALPAVGGPNAWKNDAGTTMSIADFIGPTAQAVLDTVNALNQKHVADAGTGYDVDYKQAAQAVVVAKAQLALAQQQLAKWIPLNTPAGGQ